jgi:hypothetical protein
VLRIVRPEGGRDAQHAPSLILLGNPAFPPICRTSWIKGPTCLVYL